MSLYCFFFFSLIYGLEALRFTLQEKEANAQRKYVMCWNNRKTLHNNSRLCITRALAFPRSTQCCYTQFEHLFWSHRWFLWTVCAPTTPLRNGNREEVKVWRNICLLVAAHLVNHTALLLSISISAVTCYSCMVTNRSSSNHGAGTCFYITSTTFPFASPIPAVPMCQVTRVSAVVINCSHRMRSTACWNLKQMSTPLSCRWNSMIGHISLN